MNIRFGGRYQLVREIGAGGMGRVFQALDTETGQSVAAKVLVAGSEENLEGILRFYQEAAVLSTLKHPNIVRVYGTYLEEQASCIVMELLEGRSLGQILRRERISPSRIKHIMEQVVSALDYAHSRAIVHRDIKPDNIMIVGDDRVKVTDFGIARVLLPGLTLQTMTGHSIGTPLYMSPEQIEGGKVDGRTDIYSLGAVLYHCVTGRPPFEGDDPLTIAFKHVHKSPDPPRTPDGQISGDWENLILTMLAKDPAHRYQTAPQLSEALTRLSVTDLIREPSSDPGVTTSALPPPTARQPRVDAVGNRTEISPVQSPPQAPPATSDRSRTEVAPSPDAGSEKVSRHRTLLIGSAAAAALLVIALIAALVLSRVIPSSQASPPASPKPVVPTSQPVNGASLLATWKGSTLFDRPEDVAFDGSGRAYVADYTADRVALLDASGRTRGSLAGPGKGPAQLSGPSGVAVDGQNNVFIADSNNARVLELSSTGKQVRAWGTFGRRLGQFDGPHDVAVDAKGNVYVTDFGNNRVQKLSPSGQVVVFGDAGKSLGQFHGPTTLALDGNDNVYVADFFNNRIQKFSSTGRPLQQWRGDLLGFARPHGVAVDSKGDIFLSDYQRNRILELSPAGKMLHQWGKLGSGPGEFRQPDSIALDAQGNVYVVDSGNRRIQEFAKPA